MGHPSVLGWREKDGLAPVAGLPGGGAAVGADARVGRAHPLPPPWGWPSDRSARDYCGCLGTYADEGAGF